MALVYCAGIAVLDHVFAVESMPVRADKYRARGLTIVGGGCAATAAVAVARLGGRAVLATRLGDDQTADAIIAELQAYGVDCSLARRMPGCQSSQSAVFVDSAGERLVVNFRDRDLPDDASWLPAPASLGADVALADTRWPAGAAVLLGAAKRLGIAGVLDAEGPVGEAAEAIALASHIAFSRDGLEEWAGDADPGRAVVVVASETGAFVSVTDGANGVHASRAGAAAEHVPAAPVEAVDTLGAGDVWHGAFALRLGEGADELTAIRFANAAASLKCTRPGGRAGVPDRAEVDGFMRQAEAPS